MSDPITAAIPGASLSGLPKPGGAGIPPDVASRVADLAKQEGALHEKIQALLGKAEGIPGRLDIFHGYMGIFLIAFLVALLMTPLMRRLAIANGVVDRPSVARKVHRTPVAYLGGVAVYLGILAGILFAYTAPYHGFVTFHATTRDLSGLPGGVPISVLLGMTVIMICGLWDDVVGIDPRAKIAGMLFAAAALATEDVGVKVAAGILIPVAKAIGIHTVMLTPPGLVPYETIAFHVPLPIHLGSYDAITVDVVYWIGTAVIAIFVLGACNASNLIDGLDGLLSGVTAIANAGLLVVALGLAIVDDGPRDAPRIVLCLAVLGACLGFLPHNFNPATIFLGDAGSLLLGYCTIVIVLMLGDQGQTHLVLAGLIIYALPIIDTTLAIVRRKMSGRSISAADDQHLHHILKRTLGVKGAVFVLYGIAGVFAAFGVLLSEGRQRVIYAIVIVVASFIGVIALKIGRREHLDKQMHDAESRRAGGSGPASGSGGGEGPPKPKDDKAANGTHGAEPGEKEKPDHKELQAQS